MTLMADLKGKTVLITGASSGIGAALARGFARADCRVLVHYHSNEVGARELAEELGGGVVSIRADLSRRGAAEQLISKATEADSCIDILVNNAGTMVRRAGLLDIDDEYYENVMNINLYSVVSCTRAVLPQMLERRSGTIINISSIAGRTGGGAGAGLYGAAKAAVATFTRACAKEVAPYGIRVNAISPGIILTPFHERYSTSETLAVQVANIPQGRAGLPEEVAGPALFFASEAMSSHVTGQILEVNGGMYSP